MNIWYKIKLGSHSAIEARWFLSVAKKVKKNTETKISLAKLHKQKLGLNKQGHEFNLCRDR